MATLVQTAGSFTPVDVEDNSIPELSRVVELSSTPTLGNLLVVAVGASNAFVGNTDSEPNVSVTDTEGNTYFFYGLSTSNAAPMICTCFFVAEVESTGSDFEVTVEFDHEESWQTGTINVRVIEIAGDDLDVYSSDGGFLANDDMGVEDTVTLSPDATDGDYVIGISFTNSNVTPSGGSDLLYTDNSPDDGVPALITRTWDGGDVPISWTFPSAPWATGHFSALVLREGEPPEPEGPEITNDEIFDRTHNSARVRCTTDTGEGHIVFAIYDDEGDVPDGEGAEQEIWDEADTLTNAIAAQRVEVTEAGVVSSAAFTGLDPVTQYYHAVVQGIPDE